MDIEAATQILQGFFGANKSAVAPASHTLHLFAGVPEEGGTQLTTGYTPPTLLNDGTQWADFTGGYLTSALVAFTFTDDLTLPATHWRLLGSDGFWGPSGALASEWLGGAGVTQSLQPRMFLDQGVG